MIDNLENALGRVLAHEGGYVNHPADPGGATNRGVTQRVYDAYRERKGLARRSVRAITPDEVSEIYKRQYWDAVSADELPLGLDYAVFDYAVNSGPRRAIQDLQRELKVTADGIIGQITMRAIQSEDVFDLIERLCARRLRFLKGLKTWRHFGKGWSNRVSEVREGAFAMAQETATGLPVVAADPTPKGEAPVRESMTQSSVMQATAMDVVTKVGAGVAIIPTLDGKVQLAAIAVLGIALLASIIIFRERIKAWSDGWW